MMDLKQAEKIAKRYGVPPQGQFVRLPSIEVLHAWLKQNNRQVVGWRGDYLVVMPTQNAEGSKAEDDVQEAV